MKTWYTLQIGAATARLLRCTHEGFERLDFAPGSAPGAMPDPVSPTHTTDPEKARDAVAQRDGNRPRATRGPDQTLLDPGATEAYLTEVAAQLRQHRDLQPGPVFVAMAEARWALFQAVSGLDELPERLQVPDVDLADGEMWELSRARVRDAA